MYFKWSVQFDYYRFRDTSHTDFVTGLSWHGNDNLFSCGWDSKVKNHCVSKSEQTSEDCVVAQMETDSIDKENVKKKIAKISLVCNGNGAELESTWWLYLPPYIDTMALCSNKLIIHIILLQMKVFIDRQYYSISNSNFCCYWHIFVVNFFVYLYKTCFVILDFTT